MANILSLALRVTADASQLRLDPVQRALVSLGDQADKLTTQFAKFTGGSEAAAAAQARFEKEAQDLINTLRDGGSATEFAAGFERLTQAANAEAAAFERAARIIEANLTPLERFDRAQAELKEQLDAGRISLEVYNRATESAAKGLGDAERAARGLAVQQKEIDTAATSTTLKFNELSGVFSVLPGPLGNIAGRISGIASASEGLSRIFAGGLRAGFSNLISSVTALINPLTAALAGITAFAAGAAAVARGLVALEDRVERLGRLSNQLGVSFEFVQVLEEAGRRADVSIEQLSGSFARLQNTLAGADEESKKASVALQRLGVSVQDFGELSEQQRIDLIGERLAAIEDPAERSAAAIALFGRSGVQLLPFFNELNGAAEDIQTFGAALSETDRTAFAGLGAAFDQVGVALAGLGQSVLLPFVGIIEGVATAFSGLINIVTVVAQTIGTVLGPVLNTIGAVFGGFGDAVNGTIGFFRSFFSTAEETATATERTAEAVARTAEEVKALNKAFADSQKGLDAAIAKAGEFGQAGFDAAFEFEQALADLEEQANDKELNAEQYARGVANATAEFEKQIDVARRVAEENKRLAEEAQRRAEAEAKAVQDIIDANLEQIRVDEQFGGDTSRARAADNLLRIQQEIVRVEEQLQAARAAGDAEAINALTSRIATLDQVEARENDIASGAKRARDEASKEATRLARELNQIAAERQREIDRVNEQIADAQAKFADRQFEIDLARAEELASVRTGSVEINDIRSGGISAFFDTLQEDPAIAEARKQTKELERLRQQVEKLNAEKVDILAGTG
jgi:chromosome segregation ATPase